MARGEVTHVHVRLLSLVPPLTAALYSVLRALGERFADDIQRWYETYHYPTVQKAVGPPPESLQDILGSVDMDQLVDEMYDYLSRTYAAGADVPSVGGYRNINLSMVQPDETAVAYAKRRSAELVGKRVLEDGSVVDNPNPVFSITDTMREDIRKAVEDALQEGPTPDELAKEIRNLGVFQQWRARMIARTELAFAYNSGHQDQAERMGYTYKRSVLGSEHTIEGIHDECDTNADQGWIGAKELFLSGDVAPPYHPNCVCDIEYGHKGGQESPAPSVVNEAVQQTSQDAVQEMEVMTKPFTPSTPEALQPQDAESSFVALKSFFSNTPEELTAEQEQAEVDAVKKYVSELDVKDREITKEALLDYTDKGYVPINQQLRNLRPAVIQRQEERIEPLQALLQAQALAQDAKLYRAAVCGQQSTSLLRSYATDPALLVNDPLFLSDKAFFSTTASKGVAEYMQVEGGDLRKVVLHLASPKGAHVGSLMAYGIEYEREFLFPPGAVFRVVGVREENVVGATGPRMTLVVNAVYLPNVQYEVIAQKSVISNLTKML